MAEWQINGRYFESCNCAFGCPCNYNGFPTHGFCEAAVAFRVDEGNRGEVDLSGVKVAVAVQWPGAIHEGNGKLAAFIDAENDEQRQAIGAIITGEDGGLPWEILASTVTDIHGPFFETIEIDDRGTDSSVQVGDKLHVQMETFKNPVTGDPHEVHTVMPDGFIFKDGRVCGSTVMRADADGVSFDHAGNNCYYAHVEWSNADKAEHPHTRFG